LEGAQETAQEEASGDLKQKVKYPDVAACPDLSGVVP